ncbi:MAG: phosphatidate cytidylyltransferase [Candidatus Melainabacteria bacterium]|nr:phosphatidate cytidylyltransferase [Candidatus Melainabacteria bacterium]
MIRMVHKKNNILETNEQFSRVIIGLIVFLVISFSLYCGGFVLLLILLMISWQANTEFLNIVATKGINPSKKWIRFMSILFILTASLATIGYAHDVPIKLFIFLFIFGVVGSFFRLIFRSKKDHLATIADLSTSVLGFVYTGLLTGFIILLRDYGFEYAFIPITSIAFCDTAAYYGGKLFGRHKLKPEISPKKTLEGAISGLVLSLVSAMSLVYLFSPSFNNNMAHGIAIGLFCGILSQFGDLFESLLKRDAGVKDSSHILLSHGGVLDRIDSYIFVIWAIYFYISWFVIGSF